MEELTGKVALVTGAGRGIGKAIALALARAGMDIAVNYRIRQDDAESVCAGIVASGRRALAIKADVSSPSEVVRMMEKVEKALGPVSVLVNNAGIARAKSPEDITEQDWNETLAVNLTASFLTIQAVLPAMRARGWGRIINISSTAAQVGGIVGPHYAASKAGMIGLTHAYASIYARVGITVNTIAPALIRTDMLNASLKAKPEMLPVGRFGTMEETADVALMLVRNGYITGQTIQVNGGLYMT